MTHAMLRLRQRLTSDEDRQAHEAVAMMRRVRLEQAARRRQWRALFLWIAAVVIALALTIALIAIGAFRGGSQ